jgi:hypothetical protein
MAKRAERAYRHELADYNGTFIDFGYWDSLKKGLLSGDRLYYALKRMASAYYENNRREYELTKHISISQIDPTSLIQLREKGSCEIDIPEVIFNLDYPSHYLCRVKSVSLSIPCITGPYTGVSCTLTLLNNRIRVNTDNPKNGYIGFDDPRFISNIGGIQSIATSNAREDNGLFEFNLRDERYLPFEGAGVIGRWRIELSEKYRQFDYDSIADVILHMRYTAREGGTSLKTDNLEIIDDMVNTIATTTTETGLFHFISLKREFGNEFYQLFNPIGINEHRTSIVLSKKHFYFLIQEKKIDIQNVIVVLKLFNSSLYKDDKPLEIYFSRDGGSEKKAILKTSGNLLGGLPLCVSEDLKGELSDDEKWEVNIKSLDVQKLPDTLRYSENIEGATIYKIKADEIEDIIILFNFKIS